jgi:hypothetical protein
LLISSANCNYSMHCKSLLLAVHATVLLQLPFANSAEFVHLEKERFLARHCPLLQLRTVIPAIDCTGTPLQCARTARTVAQRQFTNDHSRGYAWGAIAIRANSSFGSFASWSMKAVKPTGWYCTTLTKSKTFVVHVFRTGYRYRSSTHDQWTYLVHPHHRTEICPLLEVKAYIDQHGSPDNASCFVSDLLQFANSAHPPGQFHHDQWNVIAVAPQGRQLLTSDFDFSFPVYLHNGLGAWCMMSTSNGWLGIVVKIGYSDSAEEGFSHNKRHASELF